MLTIRKLIIAVILSFITAAAAYAIDTRSGTKDNPPGATPASGGRMYSLEAIYSRLHDGTPATTSDPFTEPTAAPSDGVMWTLNDIINYFNNDATACTAVAADVVVGKTFFATTGAVRGTNWGPVAGSYVAPPPGDPFVLPKTGQTVQYDLLPDDGYYQMGYATLPRFTAGVGAETGTVTDNATGLMWEQKTDDGTIHDWDTQYVYWTDTFNVFLNGPAGLNTVSFAGHNDWRIPNVNEMQTIVNYGTWNPCAYSIFHDGVTYFTKSFFYWTSTTIDVLFVGVPSILIRVIAFVRGDSNFVNKDQSAGWPPFYVRAVRGGSGGLH